MAPLQTPARMTHKGTELPDDLAAALEGDGQAFVVFEAMRPSCQKRYVNWVTGAKKPATRERRIGRSVEMILDYGRRHKLAPASS